MDTPDTPNKRMHNFLKEATALLDKYADTGKEAASYTGVLALHTAAVTSNVGENVQLAVYDVETGNVGMMLGVENRLSPEAAHNLAQRLCNESTESPKPVVH